MARKLLILARELNLKKELSEVKVEDLVPRHLNGGSDMEHLLEHQHEPDLSFYNRKMALEEDDVERQVGELEKKSSAFGALKNAGFSFEIYTES